MWQAPWPVKHCCSLFLHICVLLLPLFLNAITSYGQWAAPPIQAFRQIKDTVAVKQGDTAILECKVNPNFIGSYKVLWSYRTNTLTLNKKKLTADPRINSRHSDRLPHVWDLEIRHVKPTDEGDYYCIINTEPPQKRTVRLIVKAPPRMIGKPSTQMETISEGQTLRVNCSAEGKPRPIITWTREDSNHKGLRISSNPSDDMYARGGTLIITKAKRWMEGAYVCIANNDVYPPARKKLTLTVQFKPVVRLVNSRIGQQLGGVTMLQCKVEGNPMAHVRWEFNGNPIAPRPDLCNAISTGQRICQDIYQSDSDPLKKQADLTIRNVTMLDYGDYSCVATSDIGTARAYASLYKIIPLGLEHRNRRLYQNDATKGYRTPSPMTNKQDRAETLVQENTVKPHITVGSRNLAVISPCKIPLALISFSLVTVFLHLLPC